MYPGLRGRTVRSHLSAESWVSGHQMRGGLTRLEGNASWPALPLTQCRKVREGEP